jgi:hypothetical protein
MSALPPKGDMPSHRSEWSLSANGCREQVQQIATLFDHFVGAGE